MSISPNTQPLPDERHAGAWKVFFACFGERAHTHIDDIQKIVHAHKRWITEQEQAGHILAAGPFLTEDYSHSGSGLIIFRARTAQEARELAEQDPMHASGFRTFRIVPWQPNKGSVRLDVTLSRGLSTSVDDGKPADGYPSGSINPTPPVIRARLDVDAASIRNGEVSDTRTEEAVAGDGRIRQHA
jgi:uncharacterized protein YciI